MALGSAVLPAASVTVPSAAAAVVEEQPRSSVVLDCYDTTASTIAAGGAPTQITNSRTWAVSWLAAARATRQVPSGVDRRDFQESSTVAGPPVRTGGGMGVSSDGQQQGSSAGFGDASEGDQTEPIHRRGDPYDRARTRS
ncbi:hypothetical protein [Streptomyces scabichelini]|uniref:hypothetical protein n=1 Tax=Streptomyces scabichelini TaxID=2711217 RepID=UPI0019D21384|nr:hypothetical protein [Streptomyces scabichelini]